MHFEDVSSPFKEFFVFVEASCSLFLWLYPAQIFSISVRLLLFTFLYWLLFFPHLTPGHFCRFSVYYSFLWHNFLKSQLWIMCYWSHYLCAICSPGSSQMSLSIFFFPFTWLSQYHLNFSKFTTDVIIILPKSSFLLAVSLFQSVKLSACT